jgi:hypothetical protein
MQQKEKKNAIFPGGGTLGIQKGEDREGVGETK